jgi:hypothetical protein
MASLNYNIGDEFVASFFLPGTENVRLTLVEITGTATYKTAVKTTVSYLCHLIRFDGTKGFIDCVKTKEELDAGIHLANNIIATARLHQRFV